MKLSQSLTQLPLRIEIAGTSIGGSSYAHRIVKGINALQTGQILEVVVTRGDKQSQVHRKVMESLEDINQLLTHAEAKFTAFPVTVIYER